MSSESVISDIAYKVNQGICVLSEIYDEVDVTLTDPIYSTKIFNWYNVLGMYIPGLGKLTASRDDVAKAIDMCRQFGNTNIGRNYSSYVTVALSVDPDSNTSLDTASGIAAQSASNILSNAGIITDRDLKAIINDKPGYANYSYDAKIDTIFDKYDWLSESSLWNRFVSTSKYLTQRSAKLSNNGTAYFNWSRSFRQSAGVRVNDATATVIVTDVPTILSPRLNSWLIDDCTALANINNEILVCNTNQFTNVILNAANINATFFRNIAVAKVDGHVCFKAIFFKKVTIFGQTNTFANTPFYGVNTTTYINNKSVNSVTRGNTIGAIVLDAPYIRVTSNAQLPGIIYNYFGKITEDNTLFTTMEFTVSFANTDLLDIVFTNPLGGDAIISYTLKDFVFQSSVSSNPPSLMTYIGDATFNQVELLNVDNEATTLFRLCELYHQFRLVRQLPITGTGMVLNAQSPTLGLDFVVNDLITAGVAGITLTRNVLAGTFYRYSFLFNWKWWLTNVSYIDRNLFINAYDRFIRYLCKSVIVYALQDVDFRIWVRGSNFY